VVTIDPNAAETINGQTTFLVPNGSSAEIICDGSNFFTVIKPFSWEPIDGGIKTAAGGTTAISWINLSAYKRLRLSWDIIPTGMTFGMGFRTSSNNGSSYDSGASDYRFHGTSEVNGAVSAIVDTLQSNFPLNSAGMNNSSAASGVIDIFNFNSTTNCNVMSRAHGISSAPALRAENINGIILVAGSRNALQLFSGAGTFSGTFQLEGVRG
jgi:hypothetical protein